MINYLQLSRNLRKYAPKVNPKAATYVFNPKGISDFKRVNPKLNKALTEAFAGAQYPVLELEFKMSENSKGVIRLKDGYKEFSTDTFMLEKDVNVEDFIPETEGCMKKMTYDRGGIEKIGEQYEILSKFFKELLEGLNTPKLELWFKEKEKYSIGNMVLTDGEKTVLKGYFSKTKGAQPVEKFHFISDEKLVSGYDENNYVFCRQSKRLPARLIKRLWILDERAKRVFKMKYGIGQSPKTPNEIAKKLKLTGSRIRDIINTELVKMDKANTYNHKLQMDLDNMGDLLSEEERYRIYRYYSDLDVNRAEYRREKRDLDIKRKILEN